LFLVCAFLDTLEIGIFDHGYNFEIHNTHPGGKSSDVEESQEAERAESGARCTKGCFTIPLKATQVNVNC